jgi:hypothetical protein
MMAQAFGVISPATRSPIEVPLTTHVSAQPVSATIGGASTAGK